MDETAGRAGSGGYFERRRAGRSRLDDLPDSRGKTQRDSRGDRRCENARERDQPVYGGGPWARAGVRVQGAGRKNGRARNAARRRRHRTEPWDPNSTEITSKPRKLQKIAHFVEAGRRIALDSVDLAPSTFFSKQRDCMSRIMIFSAGVLFIGLAAGVTRVLRDQKRISVRIRK